MEIETYCTSEGGRSDRISIFGMGSVFMAEYSDRLNSWAASTGKKTPGHCVLCGAFGLLTKDHVPPKGCADITNSVLSRLTMEIEAGKPVGKSVHIQGGLKFKTICSDCNNGRLGAQFDPELKVLVNGVREGLQQAGSNVVLPRWVRAQANLHLVAKSVIGHVLAAHAVVDTEMRRQNIGASESLRQYFLAPDMAFPPEWRLYCWPYFSRKQIILRHASWMDVSLNNPSKKMVYGHVLKFLPLGFWLVYGQHDEFIITAQNITPVGKPGQERDTISFDLRHTPRMGYPEHASGHHVLLFANDQSSMTSPAAVRRRR